MQSLSSVALPPIDEELLQQPPLEVIATRIPGCYELRPKVIGDVRGSFTKYFHRPVWKRLGLATEFAEEYVTHSREGTIRGLHFQVPPMDHAKVVICLSGEVVDVAVDLRLGSPTCGEHISVALSGAKTNALYLPPGLAHGFCVTSADALLLYKVTTVYSPEHDRGLRWDSAGIPWPVSSPLVSDRDRVLPTLAAFASPFTYSAQE